MNQYHYIDGAQKQCGPFAPYELKNHPITPVTLVWCSGMADWAEAQTVTELQFLFSATAVAPEPQLYQQPTSAYNPNQRGVLDNTLPIPKTWLVESILVTILCCLIFGIIGIVNASKVESKYYAGDYEGSLKASKEAGKWVKFAIFGGLAYIVLVIIMAVTGSLA